jgi:hypothetical protein
MITFEEIALELEEVMKLVLSGKGEEAYAKIKLLKWQIEAEIKNQGRGIFRDE